MSASTLHDQKQGMSCLYCTTTGRAFGPVFDNHDALDFLEWMHETRFADSDDPYAQDPRSHNEADLGVLKAEWESYRDGLGERQTEARSLS